MLSAGSENFTISQCFPFPSLQVVVQPVKAVDVLEGPGAARSAGVQLGHWEGEVKRVRSRTTICSIRLRKDLGVRRNLEKK